MEPLIRPLTAWILYGIGHLFSLPMRVSHSKIVCFFCWMPYQAFMRWSLIVQKDGEGPWYKEGE